MYTMGRTEQSNARPKCKTALARPPAHACTTKQELKDTRARAQGSTTRCQVTRRNPPESGTGEANMAARTGTHTQRSKALMGSVRGQRRGTSTRGALPLTVLSIQ